MNRILYVILAAAVLAAAVFTGHPFLWGIFILAAALPFISALPLITGKTKTAFRWETPGSVPKKKEFTVSLYVEQSGFFPSGKIKATIGIKNLMTNEESRIKADLDKNNSWVLQSGYCGCLELCIEKAEAFDWFGLIGVKINTEEVKRIAIMPETFPLEVSRFISYADTDDPKEYSPYKKGRDRSETFQLRDYTPGDALRQIHWKLSSKLGKLIVREPSLPVDYSILIYWDRKADEKEPVCADVLCESVTSLMQALSGAGYDYHVAWNDGIFDIRQVSPGEQLPETVAAMMKAGRPDGSISAGELFLKEGEPEKRGLVLYFCREIPANFDEIQNRCSIRLFVCQTEGSGKNGGAVMLTPERYRDEMQQALL